MHPAMKKKKKLTISRLRLAANAVAVKHLLLNPDFTTECRWQHTRYVSCAELI